MIRPILYLVGYEIISVPEKNGRDFINFCAQNGCRYRPLGKRSASDGDRLLFRMLLLSARRARRLRTAHGVDIRTESVHGLPHVGRTALGRPGLLIGALIFCFLAFFSGDLIWDIRIEGNERVPDERIIDLLRESGIHVGSKKSELDIDGTETRFLIASDEISWMAINVIGTVAEVEVREVEPVAPKEDDGIIASNLVAAKNGVIVGFEQVRGNICVSIDDAVSAGDLLVGGVYGTENSPLRFTRSKGSVFALCEEEYSIRVPLTYAKKTYTGKKKCKKTLILFEKEVKFFENSGNLYATYDTIIKEEYLNPFGLCKLPFGIRTEEYVEYVVDTAQRSEDEARAEANFLLWQAVYEASPDASLASKKLSGKVEDGEYVLRAVVQTVENIALERAIEIDFEDLKEYKKKE